MDGASLLDLDQLLLHSAVKDRVKTLVPQIFDC